jgi:hypothetical protein
MTISDLITRLEGAEGADRELDIAVARAFLLPWSREWTPPAPPYTSSLDAALGLAERVLPGSRWMVERHFDGSGWAMIHAKPGTERDMTEAKTPALALVLAVLKGKEMTSGSESVRTGTLPVLTSTPCQSEGEV